MTTAIQFSMSPSGRLYRTKYLELQAKTDKRVDEALKDAMKLANQKVIALESSKLPSAPIRLAQVNSSRTAIFKVIAPMFHKVQGILENGQMDAAALSARLAIQKERGLWTKIFPDGRQRLQELDNMEIQARRQIQATMRRVMETKQPLSARVYKSEALSKNLVNRTLNKHLALGSSVAETAKEIEDLINPAVPGGVSYRAKLLARTEVNNAFHAQSIADAQDRPWIREMEWNLSKSRNEQGCKCEVYARTSPFPVDRVPLKPHPGCLCNVTPRIPDLDIALSLYLADQNAMM